MHKTGWVQVRLTGHRASDQIGLCSPVKLQNILNLNPTHLLVNSKMPTPIQPQDTKEPPETLVFFPYAYKHFSHCRGLIPCWLDLCSMKTKV